MVAGKYNHSLLVILVILVIYEWIIDRLSEENLQVRQGDNIIGISSLKRGRSFKTDMEISL